MKLILTLTFILILSRTNGQQYSSIDSIENPKVVALVNDLFRHVDANNVDSLSQLSCKEIYCILCFVTPDTQGLPYMLTRETFYNLYYNRLELKRMFERARKSKEIIVTAQNDEFNRSNIIVLFTIYKKDELALGHEGGQLGLYLKLEGGELKFSGIEIIP